MGRSGAAPRQNLRESVSGPRPWPGRRPSPHNRRITGPVSRPSRGPEPIRQWSGPAESSLVSNRLTPSQPCLEIRPRSRGRAHLLHAALIVKHAGCLDDERTPANHRHVEVLRMPALAVNVELQVQLVFDSS